MKPVKLNSPIGKIESGVGNWFNQFWRKAPFAGLMLLVVFYDQGRWSGDGFGIVHLLRHPQTKRRSYQRL
jgi:hypothetical protein